MSVVRYYRPDKNPDETYFPGIPLRDLEQDDWDALSEKQQAAVDATPFYQKTKPPDRKADDQRQASLDRDYKALKGEET